MSLLARCMYVVLSGVIFFYQIVLSPWKASPSCRYYPTCSDYAREALRTHGIIKGGYLACKRMMRCHPWGNAGIDPVPPKEHRE
ncbi:MAG: membrane protein insertion efficiency factor YidD [Alphaproteobacteria bacterium]|nr:MAG: membrane protein insertion efficiency factor YidD [Alphaproteobacteria bacterium]